MDVFFIDTSVFCNILPVPGRDQHRDAVMEELKALRERGTLILPVTTVIETGNFIAQLPSGGARRAAALRFVGVLQLICAGKAPWTLHQFAWDQAILEDLISGSGTGTTLVQHAEGKVGTGDLTILAEMRAYARRAQTAAVHVWSLDDALVAHS